MPEPPDAPPAVRLETHHGTAALVFGSPILDRETLTGLETCLRRLADEPETRPLVLRSLHPTVFLAGAHLGEIAALDARSCVGYAALGRRVMSLLGAHPAVTVAAVDGSCSGGGFDLVLSCDAIVVGPKASFDHPGVRRGLVTGWTGTTTVRAALGSPLARAAFIGGRPLDAPAAVAAGVALAAADDAAAAAAALALGLAELDPERIELWRRLRGPRFVDRFRASMVHK
ncbi:MAG TPA: enoyl-CoA hydratase/isomerase family protein [Chondromyces sp.]|nr:enoyl-CoA hydratase/isomerase family protein [Chondromyces sp.]